MGVSGVLIGLSFVLIGLGNCLFLILEFKSLGANVLTFLVSGILAFIGVALIPLSLRFALTKSFSMKWITVGFLLYASILTILSLTKTWQLDSDTILNGEIAIMVALVGASTRLRGRLQGLLAGLPLLYIAVLLVLVEGFSTSDILGFHTSLSLPSLGLLFSWRPFEIGALFLASLGSLARALKKRVAPLAFLAMASYSLGVLVPLLLPSTQMYDLLSANFINPSLLFSSSPKLLGVIVLLVGNAAATITAIAGLVLNRAGRRLIAASSQVRQTSAPPAARSYSDS
jgi:hypothetical protein